MSTPDTVDATIGYLLATGTVTALTSTRIWPSETPGSEAANMPRASVVVRWAGSWPGQSEGALQMPAIDVVCYGATPKAARSVYLVVHAALRALKRKTYASALLHSARLTGGPVEGREPDTHWPMVWSSWTVLASE